MLRPLEDGDVVLNVKSGACYGLNPTCLLGAHLPSEKNSSVTGWANGSYFL